VVGATDLTAYIWRRGGVDMDSLIGTGLALREVRSMRLESSGVLDLLRQLEQQVGEYHHRAARVAAAIGGGHLALAREATDTLLQVLDQIAEVTTSLQTLVVPGDDLGEMMESVPELAIRARRMVISTQADKLREVLRGSVAEARTRGWFTGRFRHVDHISDFFVNEFYRINSMWMQYRRDDRSAASIASADRVTLYQTALRVAQQAMRDLGIEPGLAHFLGHGAAVSGWPEVQTACTQIVAALAIEIDLAPGRQVPGEPHSRNKSHAALARNRE
jgi:hypothetical protein